MEPPAARHAPRTEQRWSELAVQVLDEAGHRSGGARESVLRLLATEDCCLSAQQIVERLRREGDRVGTASVYRALDLLHRNGLVQRIEVGERRARYERIGPGGDHHHHAVCEDCGAITPFEDPELERAIERLGSRLGHTIAGHDVVVRGECAECARGS